MGAVECGVVTPEIVMDMSHIGWVDCEGVA